MQFYKSTCEFDEVIVYDDHSAIGSESYDFLSKLLTFLLINTFDEVKLLNCLTYKK